jgi:uncharacterized damage-inducible protein DinB
MLAMIHDLVSHKWYANAALLGALLANQPAAQDEELRKLLHHILIANRYWLFLILEKEFAPEEGRIPGTMDELIGKYRETEILELEWLSRCSESDMDRLVQTPFLSGQSFSIAQAVMQVCMHSLGHRAQCAARLRSLGGTPPTTDFILWLKDRPAPPWPSHRG